MIELTPAQVGSYDQAYAASVDILLQLVASYVAVRGDDAADDFPQQVSVMGLAEHLATEWNTEALVSALTAAVVLLAKHPDAR